MRLTDRLNSQTHQPKQLNKQGASHSVKHPGAPAPKLPWDYGRHKGLQTVCRIRMDSSCGYACFWGLFGCLAGVWGVFEVVLHVGNFPTSKGAVARVQSIRDNMQVMRLYVVVMALIRNRILV